MALKSARLEIYIYSGTAGSYTSSDLKYTLDKDLISGQTNIIFEIGNLVRDYLTHDFNNDYASVTKWVSVVKKLFDTNTDLEFESGSSTVTNFIALDGFGTFEDEINPQLSTNALISADNIYIPENTAGRFPIFAEGVGKVVIDSSTTQITDSGNSNQKIQYITIPANTSTIQVFDTDDTTLRKTITVNNVCEPKYTSFKVTFVNKFGAYEDIYFFKKTTETFSVTDETHKTNSINTSSVTYPTYNGQQQRYNVNAKTSLQMNTGFIKEDATKTIEELFLSENVYIRFDSKTLPIIPKSKSFVHKTSLNDKLINYTIDFEFAFNLINNVR
tara:strand:+ start:411 stop:1400 length:990 start_codon:yes stop_codon:yes gene_type:complete